MKTLLAAIYAFSQVYLLTPLAQAATGLEGANTSLELIKETTTEYQGAESIETVIGRLINVALGLLGIIFLILVVYAGFLYLTDQGEGKKAEKAMKLLTKAITGIVLVVAAYAISNYVIGALVKITETSG